MFKKILAGFLWAAVAVLLVAILFKFIPWDSATKTVFWIVFILAVFSAGNTPKARPLTLPLDSERIQVSMAGRVYKGNQVTALRLVGGGVLINVDPLASGKEKEKDKHPKPTKDPIVMKKP